MKSSPTHLSALSALALCCGLSGCIMRTHNVQQVKLADNLKTADLTELVQGINQRAAAFHSLNLKVDIAVSVGGNRKGTVTDYTSVSGYILMEEPGQLRILGLLPIVHTKAFDMASNGTTFKLLIPARNKAFEGSDKIVKASTNPLENLRPYIFIQALRVAPISKDEFSYLAGETNIRPNDHGKILEEDEDYDVGVLHRKDDTNELLPSRIVHIDRTDLRPFKQDIYNAQGVVETQALYSNYQDYNGIQFPNTIKIRRPQEEYEITLTVLKVTFNQPLSDNQFDLKFPPEIPVTHLP